MSAGRCSSANARRSLPKAAGWAAPGSAPVEPAAAELETRIGLVLTREQTALELLRRPELSHAALSAALAVDPALPVCDPAWLLDERLAEQVPLALEVDARYAGYVERQREEIERQRRFEDTILPAWLDFTAVRGLSNEVRQRLLELRPATLGQAARIPGVTPAAVSLLLVHLKRGAPAGMKPRRAG